MSKPQDMSEAKLDSIFGALADKTRRQILQRLARRDCTVSELAEPFDVSLPAISRHLKVLQDSGLVVQDKQGRERRCLFNPEPLLAVKAWLQTQESYWERQLASLESYISKLDVSNNEKKGRT